MNGLQLADARAYPPKLLFRECISDYAIRHGLLSHSQRITGRVLDLGCGNQPYKSVFAPQVASWLGLDWPDGSHGPASPNVIADVLRIPLQDACIDTVICTQVLEHVPDPLCLLREAARVLRPGGTLVLTAPQYNALHGEPRDFFRYTRYGLEHLARQANLQVLSIEPLGGFVALFAFIATLHCAPLRVAGIKGLWQWAAWRFDRKLYRPKDCMGYVIAAIKPSGATA